MKKLFHILKDKAVCIGDKISGKAMQARAILSGSSGEGYVDTAVKILMAVVIGALLLRACTLCSPGPLCRPLCSASRICSTMQANSTLQAVLFSCLLMTAAVWDIRKRTIPDTLCAAVFLLGLLTFAPEKLPGILLGLPLLIGAMIADSCKAGGIGGGDIKLTAACGFTLGLPAGTEGLLLGLAAFGFGYLALKAFRKIKHQSQPSARHTALPMAPFLSAGFISAYFMYFGGAIL